MHSTCLTYADEYNSRHRLYAVGTCILSGQPLEELQYMCAFKQTQRLTVCNPVVQRVEFRSWE
jgi:hypothetical protein